jgi:adenosylcobyric acid synthase
VESPEGSVEGLGLLDGETTFHVLKTTTQVKARVVADLGLFKGLEGYEVTGYEIHNGQTVRPDLGAAFEVFETPQGTTGYFDGAVSDDGMIFGTYMHGLWHNPDFTRAFLMRLRDMRGLEAVITPAREKDSQYDQLALLVRQNLDMQQVYDILSAGVQEKSD